MPYITSSRTGLGIMQSNSISPLFTFQPFLPIIPSKTFPIPFQKVLNKIDGIITSTERKLLCLFERYCYQDGLIYPKRITIAAKLGIKPRQVSNLIRSLVDKGFISVFKAALVDRHLYGKGNSYTMLFHAAYGKIAPENAPENPDSTLLKNYKDIKTRSGFNVIEFLERNSQAHPAAIVDALKELTKRWPSIKFPDKYAQKVVDIQSGNYNAADHADQVKEDTPKIMAGMATLAGKIGFSLPGIGQPKKKSTDQDRNALVNALLNKFG